MSEIKKAISAIQKVSEYRFVYNDDILTQEQKSVHFGKGSLDPGSAE